MASAAKECVLDALLFVGRKEGNGPGDRLSPVDDEVCRCQQHGSNLDHQLGHLFRLHVLADELMNVTIDLLAGDVEHRDIVVDPTLQLLHALWPDLLDSLQIVRHKRNEIDERNTNGCENSEEKDCHRRSLTGPPFPDSQLSNMRNNGRE